MANRPHTKIVSTRYVRSSQPPLDKVDSKPVATQDTVSRFLKNINYEYLRREFSSVKEKFMVGNRTVVLANPSSNIGATRPPGMERIPQCVQKSRTPGGFKIFFVKSLIGVITIYSTIRLGVWGTTDDTNGLVSKLYSALSSKWEIKPSDFKEKYNNAFDSMSKYAKELPGVALNFGKNSAKFLKDKLSKEK